MMKKVKKLWIAFPLLLISSLLLISWGGTGHYHIGSNAALSFNQEMQQFNDWMAYIASHSSDADYRKSDDPNEGVRHYIDIDNYPEFLRDGAILQSLDALIAYHDRNFVYSNGVLPWATLNSYDSLVSCMRRADWEKAKYFAADLSHYVADGHMPLHLTKNYDGQYTGNRGIHSRFESVMINEHIDEITFAGKQIAPISNVSDYVFDYIYANYAYLELILDADDYAKTFSTDYKSSAYKDALWEKSETIASELLNNAAAALAELMYNAWLEANRSSINTEEKELPVIIAPNPVKGNTTVTFELANPVQVSVQVYGIDGKHLTTLANRVLPAESHSIYWNTQGLSSGVYLISFETPQSKTVKKVMVR
jgi:hypothetical protein